jgi:putative transposase
VVLGKEQEKLSCLEVIWVDQSYSGPNFKRPVQVVCGDTVRFEGMERESKTLEVLPKRWVIECSCGWLTRYRRSSKDYELHTEDAEAMSYGAFIRLLLRRLTS